MWKQVKRKLKQRREVIEWRESRVMKKENVREINPWLERARWHTYLVDIKRKKLLESIEELDEENELVLTII